MTNRRAFLSNAWLVTGSSVAAIAVLVVLLWSPWDQPAAETDRPLLLFCAANASKPVAELIQEYQKTFGVKVEVSYDASGKLLSTIRGRGGRGDLYLAADALHIRKARTVGLVSEVLPVAELRPALVCNAATWKKLQKQPLQGLKGVLRDDLKIVLANPEAASIGQLSQALLEKAGLWKTIQERMKERGARVSTTDTVNQVAQNVRTYDGLVGIVWTATARQFDLHIIPVPEWADVLEPMQIGVLTRSDQPAAALKLARFLTARDTGGPVFEKHHYDLAPDADLWDPRPTIRLSAGAMLLPAIEDAVKQFAKREGVTILTNYDGCGLLISQMKAIKQGEAPAGKDKFPDAYLACDDSFLAEVQDWFETGVQLARNPIVLVVRKDNPHAIESLGDLADPERKKLRVGLAHPTHSALGQLTDRLLHQLKIHDDVYKRKIVHSNTAHNLVVKMIGNALDVAVVYRSSVLSTPANLDTLEIIDIKLDEAIARQPFAVAKDSQHKHLTRRLLQALVTPESSERFQSKGFQWSYEAP